MKKREKETSVKKNDNDRLSIANIVAVIVFLVLVVVFVFLIVLNDDSAKKEEKEKVEKFSSAMLDTYSKARTMELPDAKQYVLSQTYDYANEYGGVDGVDYASQYVLSLINTDTSSSVDDFLDKLVNGTNDIIDDVLNGDFLSKEESVVSRTSVTLKSTTVCDDGDIEQKFCVENLNARIYLADKNSEKWAVLIHPFMLSSSLMYNAVGEMYTSQGFNVLAPDLRGFGSSSGSVAMGYLESLDVYDWIKDLNANYARYGVNIRPEVIVVHGISLGGATTLQLATNPDIAAANGGPYTRTLTDLNVKGFVDDCGYTSMTGIITGMFTMGIDSSQLTSILGSLGIGEADFMSKFSEIAGQANIPGFEEYIFNPEELKKLIPTDELSKFNEFLTKVGELENQLSQFEQNPGASGGVPTVPGMDLTQIQDLINQFSQNDWGTYLPQGGVSGENQWGQGTQWGQGATDWGQGATDWGQGTQWGQGTTDWGQGTQWGSGNGNFDWSQYVPTIQPKETEFSNVVNGLISKALMEIIGVGLTEDNYDKYSNAFSEGRHFPQGAKVMIIHGTADTTVPHSMADIVANNVSPGMLVHRWDVAGSPHAFIVLGSKKDEYKSVVEKYTKCVLDANCTSVN